VTSTGLAIARVTGANDQTKAPSGVVAATMPFGDRTTTSGGGGATGRGCAEGLGDGVADSGAGAEGDGARRAECELEAARAGCWPQAATASTMHDPRRTGSLVFMSLVRCRPQTICCTEPGGRQPAQSTAAPAADG
jgi:hypothetical protein